MKRIWFLFISMLFCLAIPGTQTAEAQSGNKETTTVKNNTGEAMHDLNFSEQSTWVLGYFKLSRLMNPPYSTWFLKGYDEYKPDSEVVKKLLAEGTGGITITIVMGTWCPDSRREVPRFMKILDEWHFPEDKVTFIGVDDMKQSPIGDFDKLGIVRVPTFIIYKNNIEAGRIIENPVSSLEQDMVNILSRNE